MACRKRAASTGTPTAAPSLLHARTTDRSGRARRGLIALRARSVASAYGSPTISRAQSRPQIRKMPFAPRRARARTRRRAPRTPIVQRWSDAFARSSIRRSASTRSDSVARRRSERESACRFERQASLERHAVCYERVMSNVRALLLMVGIGFGGLSLPACDATTSDAGPSGGPLCPGAVAPAKESRTCHSNEECGRPSMVCGTPPAVAPDPCGSPPLGCTWSQGSQLAQRCTNPICPPCTASSCGANGKCGADGKCQPRGCNEGIACPTGSTCEPAAAGADSIGCRPIQCSAGYACPANTRCDPARGPEAVHGCVTLTCAGDAECDCGACNNGSCRESLAVCYEPPMPTP